VVSTGDVCFADALIAMSHLTLPIDPPSVPSELDVFRGLFEEAPVAYFELDAEGMVVRANRAAGELLGHEAAELAGRSVWNFAVPSDPIEIRRARPFAQECLRSDGSTITIEFHPKPIHDVNGCVTGTRLAALDITLRQRVEQLVRSSEERFRRAFAFTVVGMVLQDLSGRFTLVNEAFCHMTGYSADELIGKTLRSIIHPDEIADAEAGFRRMVAGEASSVVVEHRFVCKDGSVTWGHASVCVVEGTDEFPGYILAVVEDVTAAKANAAALQQAEEKYRSIFENAVEGIFRSTPQGQFRTANPALARMLGYDSPDQLMGAIKDIGMQLYVLPELREEFKRLHESSDAVREFDCQLFRRDGRKLWVSLHSRAIRDSAGRIIYFDGAAQDISARKNAEEALRQSEEKYRRFFEEDLAGNYITTPDGRLLACNPTFVRMFGYASAEEAQGTRLASLYANPAARDEFVELVRRRQQLRYHEKELRGRDGSLMYVIENAIGVFDDAGELVEIRGYILDDTERRKKEQALAKQAAELARSNAELEQFAYVASHDLQEPLRMISSYTQLLARRYQGKLGADADDFIAFAVDGAKRMQQLITDLLAYSRVGTRGREMRATSAEATLADALANLRTAIQENAVVVTQSALPEVFADPTQLSQMFQNLIGNAIKFRDAAEPRIHVACEDGVDGLWHFSVQDNGVGIDEKYSERIFQVFQRLHNRKEYPGTGIGLAICKKIAERHGGRIWVESQPGHGSTFRFTILKQQGAQQ